MGLGLIDLLEGRANDYQKKFIEANQLFNKSGDVRGNAELLMNMADIARLAKQFKPSLDLYKTAKTIYDALGLKPQSRRCGKYIDELSKESTVQDMKE